MTPDNFWGLLFLIKLFNVLHILYILFIFADRILVI